MEKFPIVKAGHIFNPFPKEVNVKQTLKFTEIDINYPCRLDAMAINPAAIVYNKQMLFTPGEVVISIKKFIKIKLKVISEIGGKLEISSRTRRKVLVRHSYLLMCKVLGVSPSLKIDVDECNIPKHCGFGSSSSTISAVAVAINEIYGHPLKEEDLIKYLSSNHGEEIDDNDEYNLKVVQCIGGGATSGLIKEGIAIISGRATAIAKMFYEGEILICIPKDFIQKDAELLMELEEKNLWKFKRTGDLYSKDIAYNLLHKAIPNMINGNIKELADIVFDYRFNMGSNENCSFVYDGLVEIGNELKELYEKGDCEFLALSSVGPAYFTIVKNEKQKRKCIEKMQQLNMNIIISTICNSKYIITNKIEKENYWKKKETNLFFEKKKPSEYITNELDKLNLQNVNCIDIGCGGGRYTEYLMNKGANVLSIDKYPEMIGDINKKNINFIIAPMDNIPIKDNSYQVVLSIGVIHNALTIEEYKNALKEIYRIIITGGTVILSTFTNDIITNDLTEYGKSMFLVSERSPMVLLSKKHINNMLIEIGFNCIKVIDEHITDVGSGKRYVYTLLFKK